jgi:hypothetical protein
MNIKTSYLAFVLLPAFLTGCPKMGQRGEDPGGPGAKDGTGNTGSTEQALTLEEAKRALEEVQLNDEAQRLVNGSIEITTDFTIGAAVEQAAEEIGAFVASQLPCAEITLIDNTLTVEYGAKPGNCTFKGQTYSGTHAIAVEVNEEYDILVHHEWEALANQKVTVSGFADVAWSLTDQTRHVVHELTWTRLSDGKTGVGSGDRLQSGLDGDIFKGFAVDGYHDWTGDTGTWQLDIEEIEWQWTDPVPQSGTYAVEAPNGKSLALDFNRKDEDSIVVTISSGKYSFDITVNKLGVAQPNES